MNLIKILNAYIVHEKCIILWLYIYDLLYTFYFFITIYVISAYFNLNFKNNRKKIQI